MIKVQIETSNTFIHYKNVDKVEIKGSEIIIFVGNCLYKYDVNNLLQYEIRKEKNYAR